MNIYDVLDGAGNPVYFKNNLFCLESRVKGQSTWVPFSQPREESVIKFHRYYATLKTDELYKKRVTSVCGLDFSQVAIVEYCGIRSSTETVHGNAKRQKPYTHTSPKLLKKIGEVKVKQPWTAGGSHKLPK